MQNLMGKWICLSIVLISLGVVNAQQFKFTCKAFHRPSSSRLEKRQNIERNSTTKHQHIINFLEVVLSNGEISHTLAPQFTSLNLVPLYIDLDGNYHIVLEGSDNIGISILGKNQFTVVDPYAKNYLDAVKDYSDDKQYRHSQSIVESYIEPYYFLKLMQANPDLQDTWLVANQHGVNIIIDAWSLNRTVDLRSEDVENKLLLLQDVLNSVSDILKNFEGEKAFTQLKIGFDQRACEQASIEIFKDKQICINLHHLFWDLFPELLDTKLKNKIMRENQYMQRAFFLNSNN